MQVSSFVSGTGVRVRNLSVGKEYDFRVRAENQHGTSEPCETSEPIKARHPFGESGGSEAELYAVSGQLVIQRIDHQR